MDEEEIVEEGVATSKAPGGNKKMLVLIIVLLLILIGVIVAVAVFVLGALNNANDPNIVDLPSPIITTVEDITHIPLSSHISTNLLVGPDGRDTMVMFDFTVGINHTVDGGEDMVELVTASEPVTRSIALSVLRDMTSAELNARGGSQIATAEILRRMQEEFRTNLITEIFLVNILIH